MTQPIDRTKLIHLIAYGIEMNLGGGGDKDPYRWKEAETLLAEYEASLEDLRIAEAERCAAQVRTATRSHAPGDFASMATQVYLDMDLAFAQSFADENDDS
jgi:hypothetical protein